MDAERKADAIISLAPNQQPTDCEFFGIKCQKRKDNSGLEDPLPGQEDKLALLRRHRDLLTWLLLGRGFHLCVVVDQVPEAAASAQKSESELSRQEIHPLPVRNLLPSHDKLLADAIVEEALPADRDRFRNYLSKHPLGLALIAAVSLSLIPRYIIRYSNKTLGPWHW